jgi:Family of unknown function (DUF5681)
MTEKAREPRDPSDMDHPLYSPAEDPEHPFYEGEKMETEPAPSDEDGYKVGPGFPPKKHRWKKGGPSPNPKGRSKNIPSMKPDLKKALESALNEKVVITKDKKEVVMTKAILGIQQLVNQFAKGCRYARRDVFQYAVLLGIDLHAREAIEEALGLDAQAIVDAHLRRHLPTANEAPPETHVKAPPDLVDDDAPKPEPEQPSTDISAQARRPTKMPIEPVFDENGVALPVTDRRYIRAQSERYIAWQKKQGES